MESLFVRVLTLSLTGSAVLLPLLLLAPRLRGRYAAGTLSVLWLVLALRMALPVPLSLPWTAVTVDVSALSSVTLPAAPRAPAEVPEPAGPESVEPPRAVPPAAAPEGRPLPLLELAAWVWLAGGLALVGYQGAAYLLARRRLLRGAQPGTEEERAQLAALAAELGALLGLAPGAPALVVGLGNRAITPDNIGPKAADQTMVTRHLVERVPEHFGSFRPVAALAAGVLGTTGMESGELVRAVAETLRPACVIAVDALASRSLRRVCRTIQLADTGITPGSGVGNARAALNAETLGVPVIAVGVPTVVDAATLTCDVLAEAGKGELNPAALQGAGDGLIVTPKDIDTQVHDLAKVIGYGINLALHTGLTIGDVELFLSYPGSAAPSDTSIRNTLMVSTSGQQNTAVPAGWPGMAPP